jgi:hypothetical protein
MTDWVTIEIYPNRALAEMMRELLEKQGIEAVTSTDDAGGQNPGLAFTGGVGLQVHAQDADRARELLPARG